MTDANEANILKVVSEISSDKPLKKPLTRAVFENICIAEALNDLLKNDPVVINDDGKCRKATGNDNDIYYVIYPAKAGEMVNLASKDTTFRIE